MSGFTALDDGFRYHHYLKNHLDYRAIPLLLMTADREKLEVMLGAFNASADDLVQKPLQAAEVCARIQAHLKVRRFSRETERITKERLRFMAGIAHNIRSPLNAVMLNLEIAEGFVEPNTKLQKYLKRMALSLVQIENMSRDMMDFYKAGLGRSVENLGWCSLEELLEETMMVVKPMKARQDVEIAVSGVLNQNIFTDKHILQQILLNILENAIKYTGSGGAIQVHVYRLEDCQYELPLDHYPAVRELPAAGLVFEIADNGRGFPRSKYLQVFGEYERLGIGPAVEGVGLGLAISRQLLVDQGGEIWFTSREGEGSTFAFYLPESGQTTDAAAAG